MSHDRLCAETLEKELLKRKELFTTLILKFKRTNNIFQTNPVSIGDLPVINYIKINKYIY